MFTSEAALRHRDDFIDDAVSVHMMPELAWIVSTYALENRAQEMLWRLLHVQRMLHLRLRDYGGLSFTYTWSGLPWFQAIILMEFARPADENTIHLTGEEHESEYIGVFTETHRSGYIKISTTYKHVWAFFAENESPLEFILTEKHDTGYVAYIKKQFRRLLMDYMVREECAAKAALR